MKNLLIVLLTVLAMIAVSTAVFAEDTEVPLGAEIPEETYTVVIPDKELTLSVETNAVELTLSAQDVLLFKGNTLQVKVNSANDYNLVYTSDTKVSRIPYILVAPSPDGGSRIITGRDTLLLKYEGIGTVDEAFEQDIDLTVSLGTTIAEAVSGGDAAVSAAREALNSATLAGKHTDTLTFTCEVVAG